MEKEYRNMINQRVGQEIKHWRMKAGYSREAFAEKIGISVAYLANIETGTRNLSTPLLVEILDVLEISADALLFPNRRTNNTDSIVAMLKYASPEVIRFLETTSSLLKANFRPIDLPDGNT